MRIRPFYLFALVAGGLLAVALVWLIRWRGPALRNPWSTVAAAPPSPTAVPASSRAIATLPSKTAIDSSVAGTEALELLRQRVESAGARAREGVLTFKDADAYEKFLARAGQANLTVLGKIDSLFTVRVRYESLGDLQRDIAENVGGYGEVGANYVMQIPAVPAKEARAAVNQVPFGNDTLAFLGVTGDHSTWGNGITIAVLDSGITADTTFGQGRLRALDIGLGLSAGNGAEDGHGTAVAALAAGFSPDAAGVAPGASLLSVRVTDGSGTSDIFTLAQGIIAAVDAGAQVINISMGGYATSSTLSRAIDYAVEHGSLIVAAAGNDQAAQLTWPAADPRVISVGAVDALEQQVLFSNSGPQLQITAPGYGVQTAWLNGQRVVLDGTSASAPIVAGAIAAMMSENPGLSATQAWQILQRYSNDAGAPGADPDYGNGILNVGWAMNRSSTTRVDTSIASHYYDAANNEMEFVIQNRGSQTVAGAQLTIDVNGATTRTLVASMAPGASVIVKMPVDRNRLQSAGGLIYRTQLENPSGMVDQVPSNNRKSSVLSPPTK